MSPLNITQPLGIWSIMATMLVINHWMSGKEMEKIWKRYGKVLKIVR